MEYFAGLDVSMDETHICVVDRDGGLVLETKAKTSPEAIAAGLAKAPECKRIVFETGRMAPTLYHGLDALRGDILPQNPRNFALLAEGPLDEIHKLQVAIDQYISRLEKVGAA
jgi:hypothetical protein